MSAHRVLNSVIVLTAVIMAQAYSTRPPSLILGHGSDAGSIPLNSVHNTTTVQPYFVETWAQTLDRDTISVSFDEVNSDGPLDPTQEPYREPPSDSSDAGTSESLIDSSTLEPDNEPPSKSSDAGTSEPLVDSSTQEPDNEAPSSSSDAGTSEPLVDSTQEPDNEAPSSSSDAGTSEPLVDSSTQEPDNEAPSSSSDAGTSEPLVDSTQEPDTEPPTASSDAGTSESLLDTSTQDQDTEPPTASSDAGTSESLVDTSTQEPDEEVPSESSGVNYDIPIHKIQELDSLEATASTNITSDLSGDLANKIADSAVTLGSISTDTTQTNVSGATDEDFEFESTESKPDFETEILGSETTTQGPELAASEILSGPSTSQMDFDETSEKLDPVAFELTAIPPTPTLDFVAIPVSPVSVSSEPPVDVNTKMQNLKMSLQTHLDLALKYPILLFALVAFCILPAINTITRCFLRCGLLHFGCCTQSILSYGPVVFIWTLLLTERDASLSGVLYSFSGGIWLTLTTLSLISTSLSPLSYKFCLKLTGLLLDLGLLTAGYMQEKFGLLSSVKELVGFNVPDYAVGILICIYFLMNSVISFCKSECKSKNGHGNPNQTMDTSVVADDEAPIQVDESSEDNATLTSIHVNENTAKTCDHTSINIDECTEKVLTPTNNFPGVHTFGTAAAGDRPSSSASNPSCSIAIEDV